MERKLVQQGRGAMTITLPSEWIKKNNLNETDFVNLNYEKNNIIVSTDNPKSNKKITHDIKNFKKSIAFHTILSSYIDGYDIIEINHNDLNLAQEIGEAFLTMIIIEHSSNKTIIKDIIKTPQDNFDELLKRISQLFVNQAKMLKEIKLNKINFSEFKKHERLLDKNIFYCLRHINKCENLNNSYKKFLTCTTIEQVVDLLTLLAKNIKQVDNKIIDDIIEICESYILALLTGEIIKNHNKIRSIKSKIKLKKFDDTILYTIIEILSNYFCYTLTSQKT